MSWDNGTASPEGAGGSLDRIVPCSALAKVFDLVWLSSTEDETIFIGGKALAAIERAGWSFVSLARFLGNGSSARIRSNAVPDPVRAYEVRIPTGSGGYSVLEVEAASVSDRDGTPLGVLCVGHDVTAWAVDLDLTSQRYRDVVDLIAGYVWETDETGQYAYLSDRFESVTGEPAANVLGRTIVKQWNIDAPDIQGIERRRSKHETFRNQLFKVRTYSGDVRYRNTSGRPRFDIAGAYQGYRGVTEDVTAQVLAQMHGDDGEARLRGVLENSADAVITIDSKGRIETFNRAAELMFGYEASEVLGRNVSLLVGPENQSRHDDYIASYLTGARAPYFLNAGPREVEARRKDGSAIAVELSIGEIVAGNERAFVGSMRDISERKAVEARLREAQRMEAIGALTSGVAHDFNNLLMLARSNLELAMSAAAVPDALAERLRKAIGALDHGAQLTQQLLAYARRQNLEPTVIDSRAVVEEVVDFLHRSLRQNITIDADLTRADRLPPIYVDRTQLHAALINIAINAQDAMPDGGTLTIRLKDCAAFDEPGVSVTVSDTGTGMPAEVAARVFDPFFTTKGGKGSGLGLSMVHGFVAQSGGTIDIETAPGEGTAIKVCLPAARAEQRARVAAPEGNALVRGHARILLVEDNEELGLTTAEMLASLGYQVTLAADDRTAETLMASGQFDLLFTDVVLPGSKQGPEIARAFRALFPAAGVLYVSGNADLPESDTAGAELLRKPYSMRQLSAAVAGALQQPRD